MLIKLNWLVKNRPEHYKLYCDWEDTTLHSIGKAFGWQSKEYFNFSKLCATNKFIIWSYDKKAKLRIDKLISDKEIYKYFIDKLVNKLR